MALERWDIDPDHSSLNVSVRHLGISAVRGHFRSWSGTVLWDPRDPNAFQVDVEIGLASVDTGSRDRDADLRSDRFLDVEHHPYATFNSTRAERIGPHKYVVWGTLSLRGQTMPVAVEVSHSEEIWEALGNARVGFQAKAAVNRRDFGIEATSLGLSGGLVIGEEVEITIEAEAVRHPAPPVELGTPLESE